MSKVPYANAIGSVMYSMICTRPNLAFALSLISRFMSNPRREHWNAVKWVLRYIKATTCFGLHYKKSKKGKWLSCWLAIMTLILVGI